MAECNFTLIDTGGIVTGFKDIICPDARAEQITFLPDVIVFIVDVRGDWWWAAEFKIS